MYSLYDLIVLFVFYFCYKVVQTVVFKDLYLKELLLAEFKSKLIFQQTKF